MGGTWAVRMLGAMAGHRTTKPVDVEPEPIKPGAWADWAADWAREQALPGRPGTHRAPRDTRVAPGRFELNPAVYMRGSGLRWSR